jgi:hypothetical protein
MSLNPRRRQIAPLAQPRDFLGYAHHPDGRTRVRRGNVDRMRRRVAALDEALRDGRATSDAARSAIASWIGLAGHADVFASLGRFSPSATRETSGSGCSWPVWRSEASRPRLGIDAPWFPVSS